MKRRSHAEKNYQYEPLSLKLIGSNPERSGEDAWALFAGSHRVGSLSFLNIREEFQQRVVEMIVDLQAENEKLRAALRRISDISEGIHWGLARQIALKALKESTSSGESHPTGRERVTESPG